MWAYHTVSELQTAHTGYRRAQHSEVHEVDAHTAVHHSVVTSDRATYVDASVEVGRTDLDSLVIPRSGMASRPVAEASALAATSSTTSWSADSRDRAASTMVFVCACSKGERAVCASSLKSEVILCSCHLRLSLRHR